MKNLNERVKDRIRDTICRVCIYRTANGDCSRGAEDECPILSHTDQIIDLVRSIQSASIDPYVQRLREVVCRNCLHEDVLGHCKMRSHADCTLDDYFVLLVELVEQELDAERLATTASVRAS